MSVCIISTFIAIISILQVCNRSCLCLHACVHLHDACVFELPFCLFCIIILMQALLARLSKPHLAFMSRLENVDADDVKEFIEVQRSLCKEVLSTCDFREKLRERITALFDYPKYECPFKRGNKYFYYHNTGLQAQSVLYVQVNLLFCSIFQIYSLHDYL